jgi:hypothetical protein
MDHHDVVALAEELAQCACQHLPWSDQRVIALELGVGECDLAIDDMVRGAVHGARGAVETGPGAQRGRLFNVRLVPVRSLRILVQ